MRAACILRLGLRTSILLLMMSEILLVLPGSLSSDENSYRTFGGFGCDESNS